MSQLAICLTKVGVEAADAKWIQGELVLGDKVKPRQADLIAVRAYAQLIQKQHNKLRQELAKGLDPDALGDLAPIEVIKKTPEVTQTIEGQLEVSQELVDKLMSFVEPSRKVAVQNKDTFDKRLTGLLTRTPGTGKHSATPTKVVAFIDSSDNAVFVPSQLLTVKGADQDIDKESFVLFQIFKGRILFPENVSELRIEDQKTAIPIANKNNIVRQSMRIMRNKKNVIESHQSVEGILERFKKLLKEEGKAEKLRYNDYTSWIKAHTEIQVSKALISAAANSQKIHLALSEYNSLQGDNMGFEGVLGKNKKETALLIAGLINAATDTVKHRILAPLGINMENINLVTYWLMQGESIENIVKVKLKDPALQKYFKDVNLATQFDGVGKSKITKPTDFAGELDQAEALGLFASLLPTTENAIPSSMEDWLKWRGKNKLMMSNLGIANFDIFAYLQSDPEAQKLTREKIQEGTLNPLEIIDKLPHIKGYFNLINQFHQKRLELEPIYKLLYNNGVDAKNYNAVEFRVYNAVGERWFYQNDIKSASGPVKYDLTSAVTRDSFQKYMNGAFLEELHRLFPNNAFVRVLGEDVIKLSPEDRDNPAIVDEQMLQIRDIRSFSDQRQAEIIGGFMMLPAKMRQDLFYLSVMMNGLAETSGSFAALFRGTKNMTSWNDFLENDIKTVFQDVEDGNTLVKLVRSKIDKNLSSLSLPFDLTELNLSSTVGLSKRLAGTRELRLDDTNTVIRNYGKNKEETFTVDLFRGMMATELFHFKPRTDAQRTEIAKVVTQYIENIAPTTTLGNVDVLEQILEIANKPDKTDEDGFNLVGLLFTGKPAVEVINDPVIKESLRRFDNLNPNQISAVGPDIITFMRDLIATRQDMDNWTKSQERLIKCNIIKK
jgi:hypothetical protein